MSDHAPVTWQKCSLAMASAMLTMNDAERREYWAEIVHLYATMLRERGLPENEVIENVNNMTDRTAEMLIEMVQRGGHRPGRA